MNGASLFRGLVVALGLAAGSLAAHAQDFSNAAPAWPPAGAAVLLERGLPATLGAITLDLGGTRWFGLPELTTRSLALGAGWRSLRAACGLSETGDAEVGWTSLAAAAGVVDRSGGAALRGVIRRETEAFPRRDGYEVGFGAWMEAAEALEVWASAPQVWTRDPSPPLGRGLELGLGIGAEDLRAWVTRTAVVGLPHGGRGEHAAGLSIDAGPLALWLAARDHPLRGGLGVRARAKATWVAAEVEGHPVLGETVRLFFGARLGGAP